MSEQHDELRWRDGAAPIEGLAQTLVAYSRQGASDAELARLRAALSPQLARPTSHAPNGELGWSSMARLGTWVSVALLGAAAVWNMIRPDAEPVASLGRRSPAPVVAPRAAPLPDVIDVTDAPSVPLSTAGTVPPRTLEGPSARKAKPAAPELALAPAPAAAPALSVEAELELLRKAQSALNHSASTALALASEHAQLYPNGAFAEEREMLRIEAELTLGHRRSALERAKAFSERFGRSTYRARIERLLGAHEALEDREASSADRTY